MGTSVPLISPRLTRARPSRPTISTVGGRLGTSSDWIGGSVAATKMSDPTAAMIIHSANTKPQYTTRERSERPLPRRLLRLPRLDAVGRGLFPERSDAGAAALSAALSRRAFRSPIAVSPPALLRATDPRQPAGRERKDGDLRRGYR